MKRIPLPLLIALAAFVIAMGVFVYASDAIAYGGSSAATCNNCHIMDEAYESWYHGAHQEWTTCSDCHTPHALIPKYYIKAKQGAHDVYVFVFRGTPQTQSIHTSEESRAILQENCIRCHADTVETVMMGTQPFDRQCWDCHRFVAHDGFGLSPSPYQDTRTYPQP